MKKIYNYIKELEEKDKIMFFLIFTTIGNIFMAILKFCLAIFLPSLWFGVNAGFLIILSLSRFFSIRDYTKSRIIQDELKSWQIKYKNYLLNGVLLILLGIMYFFISVYMYFKGTNTNMHEYLTYLVALISFWSFGTSIYGIIKYRKIHTPIIKAVKITNFAYALTSVVLTQVTLLDTFASDDYVSNLNGYTGMIVSIIIMILGIYMIIGIQEYTKN